MNERSSKDEVSLLRKAEIKHTSKRNRRDRDRLLRTCLRPDVFRSSARLLKRRRSGCVAFAFGRTWVFVVDRRVQDELRFRKEK